MNLEQLYFIAEIIAAIAVVLSLIYLASQVKQTRLQHKTAAMDLIAKQRADFVDILATNKELCYIISKGLIGDRLSNLDYNRFNHYLYSICVNFEIAFIKYHNKSISNESWEAWNEGCNAWFMFPGFQTWWENNHVGGFTKSFKAHVDHCIAECNNYPNKNQKAIEEFLRGIEYPTTPETNIKKEQN